MKSMLVLLVLVFVTLSIPASAATADTEKDREQLRGTWSGSWIPEGQVRDAMTIELSYDDNGTLGGRFVTPTSMNFTKATFNNKTRTLLLEAADAASGKQYKLDAKVEGTEIKGTAAVDSQRGQVHLIKWTYVPRINGY
jgi:hypothetical protein